jgi:hypothetical protein
MKTIKIKFVQNLINDEEEKLNNIKSQLAELETKWFKSFAYFKTIKFLKYNIELKEKLIENLKQEASK